MAVATRTDTNLAATITQTSLVNTLLTAFTNAGFSPPTDNYTSGTDRILVYSWVVDGTRTFGTIFLRIRVTNTFQVFQQLFTGWNTSTKVGTNGSTEVNAGTFVANNPIQFTALNAGGECKLISVVQGTVFMLLGLLIPDNRPAWWDLNSWSWGFIFTSATLLALRGSARFPFTVSDYDIFNSSRMANINPNTNRRDVFTGLILLTQSNTGGAGKTSDDVAIACASGSARYDILSFPGDNRQFLLINNTAAGLAIRIQ